MANLPWTRKWDLAFNAKIMPQAVAHVSVAPQVLFRGELLVEYDDKNECEIQHILVGQRLQPRIFNKTGHIPAAQNVIKMQTRYRFGADQRQNAFRMDTCHPALSITIVVKNKTDHEVVWHCDLLGVAVI